MIYRCHRDLINHRGYTLGPQPILYRDIVMWLDEEGITDRDTRLYVRRAVPIADGRLLDYMREVQEQERTAKR